MSVVEVKHPLISHKLGLLRTHDISVKAFRELVSEIGSLLTFEATRDLPLEDTTTASWQGDITTQQLAGKKLTLVPLFLREKCCQNTVWIHVVDWATGDSVCHCSNRLNSHIKTYQEIQFILVKRSSFTFKKFDSLMVE